MTNKQIQQVLIDAGFDVGKAGADGFIGRDTQAALRLFQKNRGLLVTGVADELTLRALGAKTDSRPMPAWIVLANQKKGLHEVRDNSILRTFLKLGKGTVGDPAKLPWCGDFVETCLAVTLPNEALPANPYAAINWAKWGVPVTPRVGAVLSFHRGDPKNWQGHVGFYVGEDATHFHVLGGNQSNAVTISRIAKNRLRPAGSRWPSTYPANTTARVTSAGNLQITTNEA